MSDTDSDDSLILEALEKKLAEEWDPDRLQRPNVSLLPLSIQLQQKSKVEAEDNVDHEYQRREEQTCDDLALQNEPLINALKETFEMTEMEKTNIFLDHPGRKTILPECSGLLFSDVAKGCVEKLLYEKDYSTNFKTFMHNQLAQNIEEINVVSSICKCTKLSSEEWHCVAKYFLFAMSICRKEKTVDEISYNLLQYADSYTFSLEDFLQVLINWGMPETLLHPPFVLDQDVLPTAPQNCNLAICDYSIFKVIDLVNQLFYYNKINLDLWSRMIFVRALIMMWLDNRFTVSWDSHKFKIYVTNFLDSIDESVENMGVICSILDFSNEHNHNQSWIIKQFLEGDTLSMKRIGYYMASQFLLRVFCHETTPYRRLNLTELHTLLESAVLQQYDMYSVYVILIVVDAYLTSYNTTVEDKEILKSITQWTYNTILSIQDGFTAEMLDRQIIFGQMRHIHIKLKLLLEEYSREEVENMDGGESALTPEEEASRSLLDQTNIADFDVDGGASTSVADSVKSRTPSRDTEGHRAKVSVAAQLTAEHTNTNPGEHCVGNPESTSASSLVDETGHIANVSTSLSKCSIGNQ